MTKLIGISFLVAPCEWGEVGTCSETLLVMVSPYYFFSAGVIFRLNIEKINTTLAF